MKKIILVLAFMLLVCPIWGQRANSYIKIYNIKPWMIFSGTTIIVNLSPVGLESVNEYPPEPTWIEIAKKKFKNIMCGTENIIENYFPLIHSMLWIVSLFLGFCFLFVYIQRGKLK